MTARVFPVDAVAGSPSITGRYQRQTGVSPSVAQATGTRPLGGLSGVRPGTPINIASATSTTWTVTPFLGMIDGEASAAAGVYAYSFDANVTGSVTAAGGSARVDRLDVQVSDPAESDGSSVPSIAIIYTVGTPSLAAAPARSHPLAQINVPASGGGSPTVSWTASYYCAPGGYVSFNTLAGLNLWTTASVGQHATVVNDAVPANNTDFVFNGTIWENVAPFATSAGTVSVASSGVTTVTFPTGRFTLAPIVQASVITATSGTVSIAWIGAAPTSTSFSIRIFTLGGSQIAGTVHWTAVQMTPTSAAG